MSYRRGDIGGDYVKEKHSRRGEGFEGILDEAGAYNARGIRERGYNRASEWGARNDPSPSIAGADRPEATLHFVHMHVTLQAAPNAPRPSGVYVPHSPRRPDRASRCEKNARARRTRVNPRAARIL